MQIDSFSATSKTIYLSQSCDAIGINVSGANGTSSAYMIEVTLINKKTGETTVLFEKTSLLHVFEMFSHMTGHYVNDASAVSGQVLLGENGMYLDEQIQLKITLSGLHASDVTAVYGIETLATDSTIIKCNQHYIASPATTQTLPISRGNKYLYLPKTYLTSITLNGEVTYLVAELEHLARRNEDIVVATGATILCSVDTNKLSLASVNLYKLDITGLSTIKIVTSGSDYTYHIVSEV